VNFVGRRGGNLSTCVRENGPVSSIRGDEISLMEDVCFYQKKRRKSGRWGKERVFFQKEKGGGRKVLRLRWGKKTSQLSKGRKGGEGVVPFITKEKRDLQRKEKKVWGGGGTRPQLLGKRGGTTADVLGKGCLEIGG